MVLWWRKRMRGKAEGRPGESGEGRGEREVKSMAGRQVYTTRHSCRRLFAMINAAVSLTAGQGVCANLRLSDGHAQSSAAEIQARMSKSEQT